VLRICGIAVATVKPAIPTVKILIYDQIIHVRCKARLLVSRTVVIVVGSLMRRPRLLLNCWRHSVDRVDCLVPSACEVTNALLKAEVDVPDFV
jgi:hypothetical protein